MFLLLFGLAAAGSDTLRTGDALLIEIMGYPEFTERTVVQENGIAYLRLLGDVPAGGLTMEEFKDTLRARLLPYYKNPVILVTIENTMPPTVLVTGRVIVSAPVEFKRGMTLTAAISAAGGTGPDANLSRVIIRSKTEGKWSERTVNLKAVMQGKAEDPALRPGDMVIVPKSFSLCTVENFNLAMSIANTVLSAVAIYLLLIK